MIDTTTDDPATGDPTTGDPTTGDPATGDPATEDSMTDDGPAFHLVGWLILRRGDLLLLARRAGVGYADGHWGLPGGHVQAGETLAQAASREAWEEVGVRAEPEDLVPVGMSRYVDGGAAGLDVFFTASGFSGEPRPVSECDRVGWFAFDALPQPILPWLPGSLQRYLVDRIWFDESLS